jgi:hypothetical protein
MALTVTALLGGLLVGLFLIIKNDLSFQNFAGGWSIGFALVVASLFFGFLPTLIGAFLYSLAAAAGRSSYFVACAIALVASIAIDQVLLDGSSAMTTMAFAVPIALLTHYFYGRMTSIKTGL